MSFDQSQTPKLDKFQKQMLRDFKQSKPVPQFGASGRVTVLIVPVGNGFARMTTAIAAKHENKVRRKVGEWFCMDRFDCYQFVTVPASLVAQDEAEYFATELESPETPVHTYRRPLTRGRSQSKK